MAGSVQFKGKDQVIQAFQNRDVDAWSVWQHKQYLFKGFGDAELSTLLQNLSESSTNAIYTIKVYEDILKEEDMNQVKEKTPCDGSFNFKLNADSQEITGAQYGNFNRYATMQKEIDDLKELLAERDNEPEAEEQTVQGAIGNAVVKAIEDPSKLKQWIEVLQGFGILQKPQGPAQQPGIVRLIEQPAPAAVGNINTAAPAVDLAMWERIYKAVEIMEKVDPKLMEHFEKLAMMAQDNPDKFKGLLLILETF